MSEPGQDRSKTHAKPRVLKAPAVRRAELIDCAQGLFLSKGYERTTINDVIAATGLSKGAFYHHFRAKEDLLEALAERFGRQALGNVAGILDNAAIDALQRLNLVMAMGREWKLEHLSQLRAMFTVLLRPENAMLYHRIVSAVFQAIAPILAGIIEQGRLDGSFDVIDARTTADALLWLAEGRRTIVLDALTMAQSGDIDTAIEVLMRRVRAEEQIADRILGAPPGSVGLIGSEDELRVLVVGWIEASDGGRGAGQAGAATDASSKLPAP